MQTAATASVPVRWWCVVAVATLVVGVGGTSGVEVLAPRELSAAVLADGFAVLDGTPTDRHVTAVGWDGQQVFRRAVPVIAPAARMVGTWGGIAVGWQDRDKVLLARVTGDGELGERSTWGKGVVQLCDGTASNAHQWGIGWLQKDGRVWVLHGPTRKREPSRLEDDAAAVSASAMARTTWCGVASAGKHLVLLWRDTANRTFMNQCDDKRCESAVVRLPIATKHQLAGIACVERMCLLAVRDDRGGASLAWITTLKGKVVWAKPLADATAGSTFSITAAGDQAFVVGYVTREGATAARVIESGSMVRAWADPYSSEPPVLAWASDRLLVAHRHGENVAAEVVPLPR